jgi:aminobenzoyl-glutamate utilization protein B
MPGTWLRFAAERKLNGDTITVCVDWGERLKHNFVILALSLLAWLASVAAFGDEQVLQYVEERERSAIDLATEIWELAELGYLETKSSAVLQKYLRGQGFKIQSGVAEIPTAFVATAGKGGPTIGILAEFDALPGLSQAASPSRQPLASGAPGHACGHHLFGSASVTAATALNEWLRKTKTPGTVKLFGTPAEEGGSGKVYLARAGLFDDVDVVLHWHPSDGNSASPSTTTSNKSGRFTFRGKAAHAASAPDKGRSALDGVEAMNFMVNLMREHVPQTSRIHYVITDGGDAPNIVPEEAQVYYYVRHPKADMVVQLFDRVVNAAKAAAMGTETEVDVEVMHGNYPVLPNHSLSKLVDKNMRELGGIAYTREETEFAKELRKTLIDPSKPLGSQRDIQPFQPRQGMGSTDVGDVSWLVPTVGFGTATWVPGTPAHSWQAVAAGGMSIGHKGMLLAAKLLAKTGADLFTDPDAIQAARAELIKARGPDFKYSALLGDRDPPLDYRL